MIVLKPQDIAILCKLISYRIKGTKYSQQMLSVELGISASEINIGLSRLLALGLLSKEGRQYSVMSAHLKGFVSALHLFISRQLGAEMRGITTAWSAPFVANEIISEQHVVWPCPEGESRGLALEPLYPSLPQCILRYPDEQFYRLLVIIDLLEIGRARERAVAMKMLDDVLSQL